MRKVALAALVLAAVALFFLWPRPETPTVQAPAPQAEAPRGHVDASAPAAPVQRHAAEQATQTDGFIEVHVKPRAAHVRLYLRASINPNTQEIDWQDAGAADGDNVRFPAKPGAYVVSASAPGFATVRREVSRPQGEAITRVVLELRAGVTLTGRTVAKDSNEAVPLARITLQKTMLPAEEQAVVTSDERGMFRIDGLDPGAYRLTAQAPGFARLTRSVDAPGDVTLKMVAASFIEGVVIGADGKPAGGAEVLATSMDTLSTTASASGAFSIEVPPRTWQLSAKRGDESGALDKPVTVAAGMTSRDVRIQLGAAAGIEGTVVDARSQQPIAGAHVAVSPYEHNGDSGNAITGATGTYSVLPLPPGSYDVDVSAPGHTSETRRGITVSAGQRFPLRVELRQNGSVEGVVRDGAGHGVALALVRGRSRNGPEVEARADDGGAYKLVGLPVGRAEIAAMRDAASLGSGGPVEVPEGGATRLDITLPGEGVVQGTVRKKDGSPASGFVTAFRVNMGAMTTNDMARATVEADGSYRFVLPPAKYVVRWMFSSPRSEVVVEADKTQTVDLTAEERPDEATNFTGLVLEPGGVPSPFARVRAVSDSPRFGMMISADESGKFSISRTRMPNGFELYAANGGRTARMTVAADQKDVTVQLQPAATLRGHVTGHPASFTASVTPDAPGMGMFMGGELTLEFAGDQFEMREVPAGAVHVVVKTSDGRTGQTDLKVAPGAVAEVEIELANMATLSGRLLDPDGAPLGTGVMLMLDHSPLQQKLDGTFLVEVGPGEHDLLVAGPRYAPLRKQLTVAPGDQVALGDLKLTWR